MQGIAAPRDLIALQTSWNVLEHRAPRRARWSARRACAEQTPPTRLTARPGATRQWLWISSAGRSWTTPGHAGLDGVIRRATPPSWTTSSTRWPTAKRWVASLERVERERTGIKTLKVGYNKVFGYYLEITHTNAEAVPGDYIRKQTLVNAERYITPELKEHEALILNAEERTLELERALSRAAGTSWRSTPSSCWRRPGPWRTSTSTWRWPRWPPPTAICAPS